LVAVPHIDDTVNALSVFFSVFFVLETAWARRIVTFVDELVTIAIVLHVNGSLTRLIVSN